jgi:hypothetical protein
MLEGGCVLHFPEILLASADSRSRRNNQLKAKLLRPFGQRSDLLVHGELWRID